MANDPLTQLTERQRQLLDLVFEGIRTSKDIAAQTGLAPKTVDNTLLAAARVLGERDRIAAANKYRNLLIEKSPELSPGRTKGLANAAKTVLFRLASSGRLGATMVRSFLLGVPIGGRNHTLQWDQITLQILRVAVIGAIGVSVLVLFVLGFYETFGSIMTVN